MRGIEPRTGVNEGPVGPQSRPDRAPVEGTRGNSLHLHRSAPSRLHRGIKPGAGVNESPVGWKPPPNPRARRGRERRFPSPPLQLNESITICCAYGGGFFSFGDIIVSFLYVGRKSGRKNRRDSRSSKACGTVSPPNIFRTIPLTFCNQSFTFHCHSCKGMIQFNGILSC